jgi:hypothetical protein
MGKQALTIVIGFTCPVRLIVNGESGDPILVVYLVGTGGTAHGRIVCGYNMTTLPTLSIPNSAIFSDNSGNCS